MAEPNRFRNFVIIFYLDSAPENWKDIITDWHIECFLSPYHDKDVNPDGELKKPHYHLLLCFEGKKSLEQVQKLSDQLSGVLPEVVNSLRGYARYLCHLDNPDKYQYSVNDVLCFSGAEYQSVIGLPYDRYKILEEITVFCTDNFVTSLAFLMTYARLHRPDWFRVVCDNTIYINFLVRSIQWTLTSTGSDYVYLKKVGKVLTLDGIEFDIDDLPDAYKVVSVPQLSSVVNNSEIVGKE